jgi:hypothetical protein
MSTETIGRARRVIADQPAAGARGSTITPSASAQSHAPPRNVAPAKTTDRPA